MTMVAQVRAICPKCRKLFYFESFFSYSVPIGRKLKEPKCPSCRHRLNDAEIKLMWDIQGDFFQTKEFKEFQKKIDKSNYACGKELVAQNCKVSKKLTALWKKNAELWKERNLNEDKYIKKRFKELS